MVSNYNDPALILFDSDFRITDNLAFFHALKNHQKILPLFILDEKNKRKLGGAAKWFLHNVLISFAKELQKEYSLKLILKKGDSLEILEEIFASKNIKSIYFNCLCEPYNIKLQNSIRKISKEKSVTVFDFKSQTLFDFNQIKTQAGSYFKVFTPFFNECKKNFSKIEKLLPKPENIKISGFDEILSDNLDLLPKNKWADNFSQKWIFDYKIIKKNLDDFCLKKILNYKNARDFPAIESTSKISPYLSFGMISPKQIFWQVQNFIITQNKIDDKNIDQYLAEICWREFCHHLIFHFPQLPTKSFKKEFDKFPWQENDEVLKKWQQGKTGYPIIDAGMRELWLTGSMHNRVRMIVASFLTKDLMIDWRIGENWFWDCLVDANLANNVANWQWVAGSGADAAPYFRIFNPTIQGERFDPNGDYVRKWIPEISKLPNNLIHKPWKGDMKTLEYYKIKLEENYPKPIVDHSKARELALTVFKSLRHNSYMI
jgi:deoxyribodipyrimidine photo-lyase